MTQIKVRPPVRYFGGKYSMLGKLSKFYPQNNGIEIDQYVDAYGGSGAVLLSQIHAPIEIYNDLNDNMYALFYVLQDRKLFKDFAKKVRRSFYHEKVAKDMIANMKELMQKPLNTDSIVERAFMVWYIGRVSRGGAGIIGEAGISVSVVKRRGMAKSTSDFLSGVENLERLHHRISRVVILNRDALSVIDKYANERTFLYCDPPYVHSTRSETRYNVDASTEHHRNLLDSLIETNAYVILSGYDNDIYDQLLDNGFTKHYFDVKTVSGNNDKKTKRECVWVNYPINE